MQQPEQQRRLAPGLEKTAWPFLTSHVSEDDADQTLMQHYCNGDFRAFELLYQRHSRNLYRYVAWQTPRSDWVDEIVQDTWMRLHDARPIYRCQCGFKTFLYAIARNRMIDLLRKNRLILESELASTDEEGASTFEKMLDQYMLAENEQEQDAQSEALHEAILTLPKEQREALIAQQFSGLSLEEIAQLTGASIETVKSRLRYAMKKLRQILTANLQRVAA